ncbi:MAG: ATP-dependent DNA helicase [Candidatus Saccharibacteria bacterium]|nr:ATP-dependent DNA helicase [Candidatus Saccharibacteria bacterium]
MDYQRVFADKYNGLNAEQRAAVNQIDGPVMVVAGPGTGKTQLLTMRVANILRRTDTLPSNILCLTFTEAAATNMTERLATIIGADAYKVEINTFHGFGSSVISRFGEYFYQGANYQPADELTQAEIIQGILAKLPYDNPLRIQNKGEFTYLRDLQSLISDLKKAAINPDQLRQITNQNLDFCNQITAAINEAFAGRLSASALPNINNLVFLARSIADQQPDLDFTDEPKLASVFASSLATALVDAESGERTSTTPVTKWKNTWLEKVTIHGETNFALKDEKRSQKLFLAAEVYEKYLAEMDQRNLYDFGDMIINVINAIHDNPDLKANLQEQYQYVMVDEFQDTNDAQMRLLAELTDYDDTPNLMVVGDDDQAIYRFQGADISNIQLFAKRFSQLTQINLVNNYRSGVDILAASQQVSTGITSRLTNIDGSAKQLHPQRDYQTNLRMSTATTAEHEFSYIAESVQQLIADGANPADIAIISRKHRSLELLVPYLNQLGIKINYERQQNVFQSPIIQLLLNLANLVMAISRGDNNSISQYLPPVLADPAFGISRADFYRLSLQANGWGTKWIDQLLAKPATSQLANWLLELGKLAQTEPLNNMILYLIGTATVDLGENPDENADNQTTTNFQSPIASYYFSADRLNQNALLHLGLLNDINTLIGRLRDYLPDRDLKLADLLNFTKRSQELGIAIYSTSTIGNTNNVQLLTAHKSKGLEFPTVFIIDAESEQWGSKSRSRSGNLTYPANMPYGVPVGDDDDERRRLLYVAMTRAEKNLYVTAHSVKGGKELTALEYLLDYPNQETLPEPEALTSISQVQTALMDQLAQPSSTLTEALAPRLATYELSATDLNTFTDVMNGGPTHFLLYNLLRIPQGTSGALVFGNAVHHTMQQINNTMRDQGKLMDIDQIIQFFANDFDQHSNVLTPDDAKLYRDKGIDALRNYMTKRGDSFNQNQVAEQQLHAVLPNGIKLTGKIDQMEIDSKNRTIRIADYKTGKGIDSFAEKGNDYSKAKARRYAQQLMFYKLLIENSREYSDYRVIGGSLEFIEGDQFGDLFRPQLDYSDTDALDEFYQLVETAWRHIIQLDLPDTSNYEVNYKGIVEFEDWLISNYQKDSLAF